MFLDVQLANVDVTEVKLYFSYPIILHEGQPLRYNIKFLLHFDCTKLQSGN